MSFRTPDQYRITTGRLGSRAAVDGNNGAFCIPNPNAASSLALFVIASDEGGWEHVSVSMKGRCPNWAEMCFVKGLFWDDEDCVMQLHPPRSQWVNNHSRCLHLWRPVGGAIPTPPSMMVGLQEIGVLA